MAMLRQVVQSGATYGAICWPENIAGIKNSHSTDRSLPKDSKFPQLHNRGAAHLTL
jgi:hypothetical protein